jgi:fermentation-respiration switch protein FrsA (DUF1100 family)
MRLKPLAFPLAGIFFALQTGCNPHRFFYYPNKRLYLDPAEQGMPYDTLEYPSLNGKKLSGILFRTQNTPKATVVHFHGNYGNVSNHFLESQFLVNYGFDVLVFDYQGYGGSEGRPAPKRTIEDGLATVRYAHEHGRDPKGKVVVFGQSIGAAVAAVVAAQEPLVRAAVLESGFTSYRSMARDVTKRSVLTWLFYPIYPLFLSTAYDPINYVDKISPRPVFIIHGDNDHIIPVEMSDKLFEKAKEPKTLWIIKGAGHLECRRMEGKQYEERLSDFFTRALGYAKNNN